MDILIHKRAYHTNIIHTEAVSAIWIPVLDEDRLIVGEMASDGIDELIFRFCFINNFYFTLLG